MKYLVLTTILLLMIPVLVSAEEVCETRIVEVCYTIPECPDVPQEPDYKASWEVGMIYCEDQGKRLTTIDELKSMSLSGIYWSNQDVSSNGAMTWDFDKGWESEKSKSRGYGVICQ